MTDEPFRGCPRYLKCAVNNCPLCTGYPDMVACDDDQEKKCTIAKSIRVWIAANYPGTLKYEGLTVREFQAKTRWNNQSPEEQARIKENGKLALAKLRLNSEGAQTLTKV